MSYFFQRKNESSKNINDCVLMNHTECQYSGHLEREHKLFRYITRCHIKRSKMLNQCFRMDSQIAFFCGDSEECLTLGSDKALALAKQNIETHYVTVGVLELLEA